MDRERWDVEDEGDRAAKSERRAVIVIGVILAAMTSAQALFEGDGLRACTKAIAYLALGVWAFYVFSPRYAELRTRSKETRALALSLTETLCGVQEKLDQLRESLSDVEGKLDQQRHDLFLADPAYRTRSTKLPLPD